ncbi:10309_t:CDS:2 [Paraglomus brasilianum]|uniref:10309_t:CDS:1 n=1 Tax=Paraglomus brasilianum TaxID=144538 RepID=A0A9N8ZI02_9GLOM|nr:10309_t:CDS:2 [Paraglomus brasilianum]
MGAFVSLPQSRVSLSYSIHFIPPKVHRLITMFLFTIQNRNTFLLALPTLLSFPISSNSQISSPNPYPGPRVDHCAFAYKNRFYVYGGVGNVNEGNDNHSYFSYTNTPFHITDPKWTSLPVAKATKVSRPACSVTSDGILYVTGGADPSDNKYAGIQSFDLKKSALGFWDTPNTRGLNTSQHLSHRRGHKSIVVKTLSEEVLFIFGGSESNDAFILNVKNSTWEAVHTGPDAPPSMGAFAITSSKDKIYIIGTPTEESGRNLWAFNIPKRSWFNPHITVDIPMNVHVECAGTLNNTIYLIDSGNSSLMWKWNLADKSTTRFTPDRTGAGLQTYNYAFAQLPGSDVFITYGGKTGVKATDSLAAFNMTQNVWVTQVNNLTNIPNNQDHYYYGLLAPGQEDSFLKPPLPQKITAEYGANLKYSDHTIFICGLLILAVVILVTVVKVIVSRLLLYRRKEYKKKEEELTIVETCGAFGSNTETGSQRDSVTYRPPNFEASDFRCEHYSISSDTVSVPDFQISATSRLTVKLNSTPPTPSSIVSELRRHKVTSMTSESSSTSISPSAPEGAILDKYKLKGEPAFGVSKSVCYAKDETVNEDVMVKFFSDYDSFDREVMMLKFLRSKFVGALRGDVFHVSDAADWKYAMIMDYYPMSLDNLIVSRTETMDELCVKIVVKSLAQAIQYVHSHGIVHLDIKPGNFVHEVGDVNKWRLIDFEAARVDGEEDVYKSTLRYAPPELINVDALRTSIKADTSMDMWSFGCTIYELYTGSPLFLNDQEATAKLLDAYYTRRFEFPVKKVPDVQAQHVLEKLLVINPLKRASVEEILRGAYLTGGADSAQIYEMQSESTERIINTLNQNTNVVLSNMQEATNMILSQFDVVVNSISDTRDASVPRLFMLLPGKKPHSVFKPKAWGKNTFVVHILCEGHASDNSKAHFTDHPGYMILNPKPFLAKVGPYLCILATLIGSAVSLFTGLQLSDKITANISSGPIDYFRKIGEVIDAIETDGSVTRDLAAVQNDPLNKMISAQGPALREFKAFLSDNDPLREFGGLHRITMSDGRWRWVCDSCKERAHGNHGY